MTISIPETLTIENSGKYIMSIRLWSGGLSFSAYNPSEGQSFFFRELEFDRKVPYIASLKEFFFTNEFIVWPYKKSSVLYVSPEYTLMPDEMKQDKHQMQLLSFVFVNHEKRSLSNASDTNQIEIVYGMNEDVYEFCFRSLINPSFYHHVLPQLTILKKQSMADKPNRMNVVIHRNFIDISCFTEGNLVFMNSFFFDQVDDILYYIMYAWKQTGFNQLYDRLSLSGDIMICNKITQSLQVYIHDIGPIEIPSEAYLLGGEILQAPMDLILASVCE